MWTCRRSGGRRSPQPASWRACDPRTGTWVYATISLRQQLGYAAHHVLRRLLQWAAGLHLEWLSYAHGDLPARLAAEDCFGPGDAHWQHRGAGPSRDKSRSVERGQEALAVAAMALREHTHHAPSFQDAFSLGERAPVNLVS